jgi:hypothetical protein
MSDHWTNDDELLLTALRHALATEDQPSPEFIATAQACYSWYSIDGELAELTFDSARPDVALPATRAESASVQAMTFASAQLTIELEITDRVIRGQLVPHQSGDVELHVLNADVTRVRSDQLGYFSIPVVLAGRFRLRCHTDSDCVVTTRWIALDVPESESGSTSRDAAPDQVTDAEHQ